MKLITLCLLLTYCQVYGNERVEEEQWTAKWIGAPQGFQGQGLKNISGIDKEVMDSYPGLKPVLFFRKTYQNRKPVAKAVLYCTAKGQFQAYVSSKSPISDIDFYSILAPGWTNYNKTIQYYTFDVTFILRDEEDQTIGMVLGPGWYSGYIGNKYNVYGDEDAVLVELRITFTDGTERIIRSDETWKVNTGQVIYSDLIQGELFYENKQLYNWTEYDYDDSQWSPVVTYPIDNNVNLVEDSLPIEKKQTLLSSSDSWQVGNDTWVYIFDKPVFGNVVINLSGFPFEARMKIRYGESVHFNGSLYTGNHKNSLVTDTFLLNDIDNRPDNKLLLYTPLFTFHSFRFIEISGLPVAVDVSDIWPYRFAQVTISSIFSTDNDLINSLADQIQNSIEMNFVSVPANAPSSDSRVGWLEPAGLFSWTALYNFDGRQFFKNWLKEVRASQAPSGAHSNVAPNVNTPGDATPGSGFAPIIIAYNLYRFFEDIETVQENYISNQNWLKYVISNNPDLLYVNNINNDYGDFANVNAETPKEIIATAYFAYGTLLMSYMAKVLNETANQEYYTALHQNISEAFVKKFVNSTDGSISGDTQTAYVLALVSKVLPEELIPKVVAKLVNNIKVHDNHLTTGYVGTAFLLPVLADHGQIDLAYKLLSQETFPSWGYMVGNYTEGIWERWDSWNEVTGFQGTSLYSLGLGSVGSFLYQYIAGINNDGDEVGFKKVFIKPYIRRGIEKFDGKVYTKYGYITSTWRARKHQFHIGITLPKNTTGKLVLPFIDSTHILELSSGRNIFDIPLNSMKMIY